MAHRKDSVVAGEVRADRSHATCLFCGLLKKTIPGAYPCPNTSSAFIKVCGLFLLVY